MNQIPRHALWTGHAGDGRDYRRLFDLGIRAVVQLAAEEPPLQPPRELVNLRFPLRDGADNPDDLLSLAVGTLVSMVRLRLPTLACCGVGMSRSRAVASAALGSISGGQAGEVLRRVLRGRLGDVSPGLWEQLTRFA